MRKLVACILLLGWCLSACVESRWANHRPEIYRASDFVRPTRPAVVIDHQAHVTPAQRMAPQLAVYHGRTWYPEHSQLSARWSRIVLHHSATDTGGAGRFDKAHKKRGWDELGYHFVVGNGTDSPDGSIEVGPRWSKQKHGAHCKTTTNYYNEHGIGICLVGNFQHEKPSPKQLAALHELLIFLCSECRIPPSQITTHKEVTSKTLCPGNAFPGKESCS